MHLSNLYLTEVNHVKNRIRSLQCENTKSDCLKTYFPYLNKKGQPASYLYTFFKPKLEKNVAKKGNIAKYRYRRVNSHKKDKNGARFKKIKIEPSISLPFRKVAKRSSCHSQHLQKPSKNLKTTQIKTP